MADSRSPARAADWESFHRLAASVLPVANSAELAANLASLWARVTQSSEAFLYLCGPHCAVQAACRVDLDGNVVPVPPPTELPHSDAVRVIELVHESKPIGKVGLTARDGESLDLRFVPPLIEWTGRLVAQFHRRESLDPDAARMASLAEFAAGAGHEINNPLATISGRVQLLLREERDPERRRALATIGGQAYRIRDMIGDLMLFANPPEPRPESLNLTAVVENVCRTMAEAIAAAGCRLTLETWENVPIWADPQQLEIVVCCLMQNSLEASSECGTIVVRTWQVETGDSRSACLSITDSGIGLDVTQGRHLFDPFFSGRQAGRGLGFGLSKCWRIVTNHAGRISVASNPGETTTFEVVWPAAPPA